MKAIFRSLVARRDDRAVDFPKEEPLVSGMPRWMRSALVLYVSAALVTTGLVSALPSVSWAWFVPSQAALPSIDRVADLARLKTILEQRVVAQRLADFGFTKNEIDSRLAQLSDAQIHQTVQQIESIQPGGDSGLGVIIALLVIAILVVILLQLTGHRIVITK